MKIDLNRERVWYSGPEPGMVPATLADFECKHGKIGKCRYCKPYVAPIEFCTLCGEPSSGRYCPTHTWAEN